MASIRAKNLNKNMFFIKNKKRNFVKFNDNYENFLENDLQLKQLTQQIENGNQLFSSLIGCDHEVNDEDTNDFDGFTKTTDDTNNKSKITDDNQQTLTDPQLTQTKTETSKRKTKKIVKKKCDEKNEKSEELEKKPTKEENKKSIEAPKKKLLSSDRKRKEIKDDLNLKSMPPKKVQKLNKDDKKTKPLLLTNSNSNNNNNNHNKDIIKRELNHYADVMARSFDSSTPDETKVLLSRDQIAAKIQRLLKSQWEERLKLLNNNNNNNNASHLEQQEPEVEGLRPQISQASVQKKSKNILRKARLQLNKKTLLKIRQPQSFQNLFNFSTNNNKPEEKQAEVISFEKTIEKPNKPLFQKKKSSPSKASESKSRILSKSGQPGFITCTICNTTKYYSHVQRRYGVFSCEPCSKFFARFIKDPKQYYCSNKGDCPITDQNNTQQQANDEREVPQSKAKVRPNVSASRCKACWLKVCLQKFSIDSDIRLMITNNYSPKLINQPKVSLITVDTSGGNRTPPNAPVSSGISCETQPLLMVATNQKSSQSHSISFDVKRNNRNGPRVKRVCRSAGSVKRPPRATFGSSKSDSDSDELPVDVYLCRVYEKEMKESSEKDINTSNNDKQEMKSPFNEELISTKNKRTPPKKYRCKECEGCKAEDCGQCNYCLDKKKFGGQNVIKQACKYRTCVRFQSTEISNNLSQNEEKKSRKRVRRRSVMSGTESESSNVSEHFVDYVPLLVSGNAGHGKPNLGRLPNTEKNDFMTNGQDLSHSNGCLDHLSQSRVQDECHTLRHLRTMRNN